MCTNTGRRNFAAGLAAVVVLMLGFTIAAAPNANAMPFSCAHYTVRISGGVPPTPPGLGVAMNFQFISTIAHFYTADGTYPEPSSTSSGPAVDAFITIPGCGGFTVPADGNKHRIGLPSCDYCYDVTITTDFFGCTFVDIVRVPC